MSQTQPERPDAVVAEAPGPLTASASIPVGAAHRAHMRRAVSLVDQALSGLSNFLTIALVARSDTPAGFGHFSLAYAVLLALLAVSRGVWGTPIALTSSPAAALEIVRGLLGATVLAAPAIALLVALPTLALTGGGPWTLVLLSVAAPIVIAQDVCRFAAVSAERPWVAVASDGFWVAVVAVGYLVRPNVRVAVTMWLAGAVAALLIAVFLLRVPPALSAGRVHLRTWNATGVGVAASNIAMQVAAYVVLALATLSVSASAAGALRGASSVMAPINTLLGFLTIGLLPMVHRRPPGQQLGAVLRIAGFLVATTVAWCSVLLLVPASVGSLLLGNTWPLSRQVLPWTSLEYVALAVASAALIGVQARQASRLLLRMGLGAALTLIAAGLIATPFADHATQYAVGQVVAATVAAVAAWIIYLSYRRAHPA